MTESLIQALLAERDPGVQIMYGVATGRNTVTVAGSTVAVTMPALNEVKSGDYVAVAAVGADRLILGPVGGNAVQANYTDITPATNFTATMTLSRWGAVGFLSVLLTRTTSNIGTGSSPLTVATIDAAGRGSYSTATQALTMRSRSDSTLSESLCWVNASTGVITVNYFNTWNNGASMTFTGLVLFGF